MEIKIITLTVCLEGARTVVSDLDLTPTCTVYPLWDLRELISSFQDSSLPPPKMGIIIQSHRTVVGIKHLFISTVLGTK